MSIEIHVHNRISQEESAQIAEWAMLFLTEEELTEDGYGGCPDYYVALSDGIPVGYMIINGDWRCVAIEVKDEFLGQGIARKLVETSGCFYPEDDQCPEFWERIHQIFEGEDDE